MLLESFKSITIYEVEKLKELLLEALSDVENLELDMASIAKIDMVGIQLLISLVRTVKEEKKTITFINITEHVLKQIDETHCKTALGLDI